MLKELLYSTNRRLMCNAAQRYILILSHRSWQDSTVEWR